MKIDPSREAKIGAVYRLVVLCDTVDSFRVTPGEVTRVSLYRHLPGPNDIDRGETFVGDFSLNEAIEYLKGEVDGVL